MASSEVLVLLDAGHFLGPEMRHVPSSYDAVGIVGMEVFEAFEASLLLSPLCVCLTEIPPNRMCTVCFATIRMRKTSRSTEKLILRRPHPLLGAVCKVVRR